MGMMLFDTFENLDNWVKKCVNVEKTSEDGSEMMDRKKVIQGLEHEIERTKVADTEWLDCVEVALLRDAIALLKEQEPVEPLMEQVAISLTATTARVLKKYYCGACRQEITGNNVYCHRCGRAVKWE